jgi:alpha-mannosidase
LFQQFHDILPGTSIPEVFDQAETLWRDARRKGKQQRDLSLAKLLQVPNENLSGQHWSWCSLQPLAAWSPMLRLPKGCWSVEGHRLPQQTSSMGGTWVQLPLQRGITSVSLEHQPLQPVDSPSTIGPVLIQELGDGVWRMGNGLVELDCSSEGILQIRDSNGCDQLSAPLRLERYQDRGEFWDAWDLAADYSEHSLGVDVPDGLHWIEQGPLVAHAVLRRRFGSSALRMDLRLQANRPWLELICSTHWSQRHELLRLTMPLARPAVRVAADTSGGVIERPASPITARERARWELPVISWMASQAAAPGGGLAVLLDGPQGVDWDADRLGVSLLRGPTWPDPGADRGWHRQRMALMPITGSWNAAGVTQAAIAFREPGWWGPQPAKAKEWFPALPVTLTPISVQKSTDGICCRALNAGPARCLWRPGHPWLVRRGAHDPFVEQVVLAPGELAALQLRQSS